MHRGRPTLDTDKATRLLADGQSIRVVATTCGVTTQAIYHALKTGRIKRPEGEAAVA
jgi:hypothetical protein